MRASGLPLKRRTTCMGSAGCKRWERPIRIVRTPLGQLGQPVGTCIRRLSEAVAVAHGRKASHEFGMYKSAQSAQRETSTHDEVHSDSCIAYSWKFG